MIHDRFSTDRINKDSLKEKINNHYLINDFTKPKIFIFLDSPMKCAIAMYFINQIAKQAGLYIQHKLKTLIVQEAISEIRRNIVKRENDFSYMLKCFGYSFASEPTKSSFLDIKDGVKIGLSDQIDNITVKEWQQVELRMRRQGWYLNNLDSSQRRARDMNEFMGKTWDRTKEHIFAVISKLWFYGYDHGHDYGFMSINSYSADWLSIISYTYDVYNTENAKYKVKAKSLIDVTTNCGWWWPFENIVLISEKPIEINVIEQKIHQKYSDGFLCESGPFDVIPMGKNNI